MFEKFSDKRKFCPYFQYLSIFSIISLVLLLITAAYRKKFTVELLPTIISLLIVYFQNRLLFTMCVD